MSDIPNAPRETQDLIMEAAELWIRNTGYVWQASSLGFRMCSELTRHLADVQRTALERHDFQRRHGQ